MVSSQPAVIFDNVSVTLGGVSILDAVSADVPAGSATAIIGPNGAGKTTLLLAMLGQAPYSGRILLTGAGDGRAHGAGAGDGPAHEGKVHRGPRLGYVPQRLEFDRGLPVTVLDLLALGQRRPLWLGRSRRYRQAGMAMLAAVNAEPLAERRLGALSGGELQRVLLAAAIGQDPQILILDEPSAGVDIAGENLLCELLEKLRAQRGFTQIMVTHDLSLVTAHSTHVICLNRRVTGQGPTQETLRPEVLAETFGIHLGLAHLHAVTDDMAARASCREHGHE